MAITKADLVGALQDQAGLQKKEAIHYVELLFETMKSTLAKGEKIKISGFGNFVVRDKQARQGRNPKTGESLEITARRVLTFRPSKLLKAFVNGDTELLVGDDEDET